MTRDIAKREWIPWTRKTNDYKETGTVSSCAFSVAERENVEIRIHTGQITVKTVYLKRLTISIKAKFQFFSIELE